jgi:hypothetical protein
MICIAFSLIGDGGDEKGKCENIISVNQQMKIGGTYHHCRLTDGFQAETLN